MDTITVRLTTDPAPEWQQAAAAARAAVAAAGGATSAEGEELTADEQKELLARLASMDASAQGAKKAAREEKLEQRAALERENKVSGQDLLLAWHAGFQAQQCVWPLFTESHSYCAKDNIFPCPVGGNCFCGFFDGDSLRVTGRATRALETPHPLQEQQRSSMPFFAAFVGLFIALPVGIVLLALSSGYIDSLGPR